jgi:hypothetical protein
MLKCNGFASFRTTFDAVLRCDSVPKRAKFPKDLKAPGETPSHRGFFLDDLDALASASVDAPFLCSHSWRRRYSSEYLGALQ